MFNLGNKKKETPLVELKDINNEIIKLKKENKKLQEEIERIREKQRECIQKIGVVRFNPFKGEGGNQSFSIVILDDKDDGFAITALYTKEGSRVYGKEIKKGGSEYALSEEEKKAILKVKTEQINNNKKNE